MNLTKVGMDNFCTFHQQPHSEKNLPQWVNSMTLVMNQLLEYKLTRPTVEEEKAHESEEAPKETTMVLWDCMTTLGLDEGEPTEEVLLSAVNVTIRSKGPVMDESILLPKIRNIQKNMKKINSSTQTPPKYDFVTFKEKVTAVI